MKTHGYVVLFKLIVRPWDINFDGWYQHWNNKIYASFEVAYEAIKHFNPDVDSKPFYYIYRIKPVYIKEK